jgi:hypothetical protein
MATAAGTSLRGPHTASPCVLTRTSLPLSEDLQSLWCSLQVRVDAEILLPEILIPHVRCEDCFQVANHSPRSLYPSSVAFLSFTTYLRCHYTALSLPYIARAYHDECVQLLICWRGHEGSRLCLRLLCYATETQTFTTSSPATIPITSNLLLHHLFPVILS